MNSRDADWRIDLGRSVRPAEARRPARQAARGPTPDPGTQHLRRRREDRRHAAPRVQAQSTSRTAGSGPSIPAPPRRWTGWRRSSPARTSPSSWSGADRDAVPVARAPRGGGRHRPLCRRSGRGGGGPRSLRGARRGRPSVVVDYDPLPVAIDPETAMTGRPAGDIAPRLPEQRRPRPAAAGYRRRSPGGHPRHRRRYGLRGRGLRNRAADGESAVGGRAPSRRPGW